MKKLTIALAMVVGASLMAADGAALYKKCAGCHGADGSKVALGKSIAINTMDAAAVETALVDYKAGTRNMHGMGALMKGQVASFSDADIKAVSAYVGGL